MSIFVLRTVIVSNKMTLDQIDTKNWICTILIFFFFCIYANAQIANFETIDKEFENPPNAYRLIHYSMNGALNSSVLDEMVAYGIGGIQTRVPLIGYGRDDTTPEIPFLKRTVNMNFLCGLNQFTSYMPYNNTSDGYDAGEYKKFHYCPTKIA